MHSESLLTLDESTLFYFNRRLTRGRNLAPEQFADSRQQLGRQC
jgi:hypothetical protein